MGYPLHIGEAAIEMAKSESPKFVPSVPEVKNACEAAYGPTRTALTYAEDWDRRSRIQLAERAEWENKSARLEVVDRVRAEMAAAGMPILGDEKSNFDPQFMVSAVKEKFQISDEQWNEIPDAPTDNDYWRGRRAPRPTEKGR